MLWGTTGTSQALAPQGAQPLAIGALRILLGGLFLLIIQLATRSRLVITRQNLRPILLAAFCMAAYQVLFFAGVKMTGVAVGTIVGIGSSPIFAGLLGFFFRGERPGWRWGLATLLAIAGCVLLAFTGEEVHADPLGMLLAIGAGAVYATFSLASKEVLEEQPVQTVMAAVFCLGALLLAPLLLTQDLRWLAQPRGIAVALHLGLLTVALAYLLFGKGLRLVPLATAGTLTLAEPLTAGTLGVLVLGEKLTPLAGLGILLIFSGLVVLALPKKFELKVQERGIPRS
jgi:DME family drug/metabolite transporter